MTKDVGAHVTCHHHLGIIRVTSHWMKVSKHVKITYVSIKLQCDYLRNVIAKSSRRLNWHGYNKDGISGIMQDNRSYGTRSMRQRVWKQENPRMMTKHMMTSRELEN